MMMAAARRSSGTRKPSPKARRRSRRSHHDYHDSEQPPEADRMESGSRKSFPSSIPPTLLSRHGDVGDSGIDSGNGHAEPESPQVRFGEKSFDHASAHQLPEHSNPSSPERQKRRSREASGSSSNSSPLRKTSEEMSVPSTNVQINQSDEASLKKSSSKRSKSRHRKRTSSESEELEQTSPVREKPPLPNHLDRNVPGADSTSALETRSRTNPPLSSHVSEDSDTSSESLNHARQQHPSKEKDPVISVPNSNGQNNTEKENEKSSESESDSEKERDDDRKPSDAISVSSDERQERKRKLEARLEQAKHSLASPHITAAVEAFESSEKTVIGPQDVSLLHEFRRLFQQELIRLRLELDTFRHFCSKQMEKEAESVFSRRRDKQEQKEDTDKEEKQKPTKESAEAKNDDSATQSKEAEDQKSEEKKKKGPEDLDTWEEKLLVRQNDLHEYEREILEVETMLNQRQAICERRQSALLALDEELQSLREDIFSKKEVIKKDDDTSEERARKNWDIVRRHLTDKQAMLEAAVQRYRTQIAGSNAALAAKDTLIAHLQKQLKETQETVTVKERKVSQLESKLVLATEEMHVLNALRDAGPSPQDGDPLSRSHSSIRRGARPTGSSLLQRQRSSEASDRSGGTFRGSSVKSSVSDVNNAAMDQGPGYRPSSSSVPPGGERSRRMSAAHVPDPVLTRGKSSAAIPSRSTRPMSARERRMQQRRNSVAPSAAAAGGGAGGEAGVSSAACAIL